MTLTRFAPLLTALLALSACGGTWSGDGLPGGSDTATIGGGDGADGSDGSDGGGDGSGDGSDGSDGGGSAADACVAYVEAYNQCATDFANAVGFDPSSYTQDADTLCTAVDGTPVSLFECLEAAYADADCADESGAGFTAAGTAAGECGA